MARTNYTSSYLPNVAYSEADLEANRQGVLTQDQFQIIEAVYQTRRRGARQTIYAFLIWIPLLIIVGTVIEYNKSGKGLGEFLSSSLPILALPLGGLGLLLLISTVFGYANERDARDKRITVAEGVAHVLEKEVHSKNAHYIRYELTLQKGVMNKQLFRFANHESLAHFESGKTYRVYYIKYYPFPLMLSAEVVGLH